MKLDYNFWEKYEAFLKAVKHINITYKIDLFKLNIIIGYDYIKLTTSYYTVFVNYININDVEVDAVKICYEDFSKLGKTFSDNIEITHNKVIGENIEIIYKSIQTISILDEVIAKEQSFSDTPTLLLTQIGDFSELSYTGTYLHHTRAEEGFSYIIDIDNGNNIDSELLSEDILLHPPVGGSSIYIYPQSIIYIDDEGVYITEIKQTKTRPKHLATILNNKTISVCELNNVVDYMKIMLNYSDVFAINMHGEIFDVNNIVVVKQNQHLQANQSYFYLKQFLKFCQLLGEDTVLEVCEIEFRGKKKTIHRLKNGNNSIYLNELNKG